MPVNLQNLPSGLLDFSFDTELVLDHDLFGSSSVLILDPGSRIHLNLPLKAPLLSGVEELSLAAEIGLLPSLGKCRCGEPGEFPDLCLGGEPDQERLLLSGVRSAEMGLLLYVGDCG